MASVGEMIRKQKDKYNTHGNTYDMFPIGTKVQVITLGQDFNFFNGTEVGEVIKNGGKYLSIIVKFDEPRHFKDGYIQTEFNFEPDDLTVLEKSTKIKAMKNLGWYHK